MVANTLGEKKSSTNVRFGSNFILISYASSYMIGCLTEFHSYLFKKKKNCKVMVSLTCLGPNLGNMDILIH